MIRVLDVCSGYSASTLAWAGLGFRHVGYSEIETFPRAILEQRHGAIAVDWDHRFTPGSTITPLFGDFTRIESHHVGPVDLLTGGTPCQAFSIAGLRGGLGDDRGNLTLEFLRLAERVRAEWVAWENVPGVFSALAHVAPDPRPPEIDLDADDGPEDGEEIVVADQYDTDESHALCCFLAGLTELGYGWAYRVLDAQYIRVDGCERAVPQRRKRIIVVGHLGDAAGPAAVLFERESLRGDPAPRREAGEGIARPLAAGSQSSCGYRNDADTAENLIAATLDASFGRLQGCSGQDLNHGHSHLVAFGGNNTAGPIDVATARSSHGGPHGRLDFDSETFVAEPVSFTGGASDCITLGYDPDSGTCMTLSSGQTPAIASEWQVRRLTPTECERLMGVPDGFTAITYRGKPAADGPRYKALGNSQPTNWMRWIGHGLADVIRAQRGARHPDPLTEINREIAHG